MEVYEILPPDDLKWAVFYDEETAQVIAKIEINNGMSEVDAIMEARNLPAIKPYLSSES